MGDKTNHHRELGMNCPITPRHFLSGVATSALAAFWRPAPAGALDAPAFPPERAPDYYPPALMGMRGTMMALSPSRTNFATTGLRPARLARIRPASLMT